eukprot:scaffold184_cov179-Amphora_coffeaeformis.AAC.13
MSAALFWKQPKEDPNVRSSNHKLVRLSSTRSMTGIDIEEAVPGHNHHEATHNTNNKSPPNKQPKNKRRASLKPNDLVPSTEKSPASRGIPAGHLPLTINPKSQPHAPEPRLIHPILNKISVTTRFAFNGLLSNVLFMLAYNWSIENISEIAPPTMYSIVYLIFIPIGHAMVSLFVFGWPEKYFPSLMSNFPIGLTAIGIGGGLTAWLDSVKFNEMVAEYIRNNYRFSSMPSDNEGEFYSSIVVLVVTSLWTYILSIYVNAPPEMSEKKEL